MFENLVEWAEDVADRTLGGHTVQQSDVQFLKDAALSSEKSWPFTAYTEDLHTAYRGYLERYGKEKPVADQALSLDAMLETVGLAPEPTPHNALRGALLEAELFHRLRHEEPLLLEARGTPPVVDVDMDVEHFIYPDSLQDS
jgi:hypothetical protein